MIYEFYDKKISQGVVNQQTFDKWREKGGSGESETFVPSEVRLDAS